MAELSNIVAYGLGITAVDRDDAAAREFAALGQPADASSPTPPAAPAPRADPSPWILLGAAGVAVALMFLMGDEHDGEFSDFDAVEEDDLEE